MKLLKYIGIAMLIGALGYGGFGLYQKINGIESFIVSFLMAGGLAMTGLLILMMARSKD